MIKKIFFRNYILVPISISLLLLIQYAHGDNHNRSLHDNAELLGWLSISCGLIANIPFILYVRVKRLSVKKLIRWS